MHRIFTIVKYEKHNFGFFPVRREMVVGLSPTYAVAMVV